MNKIHARLEELALTRPGSLAYVSPENGRYTFAELHADVVRAAQGLDALGAFRQRLLPISVISKLHTLELALGALQIGVTPLPLDVQLPTFQRQAIYKLVGADIAIIDDAPEVLEQDVSISELFDGGNAQRTTWTRSPRWWKAVTSPGAQGEHVLATQGSWPTAAHKALALGMKPGGCALLPGPLHQNGPFELMCRQLLLGGTVVTGDRFDPHQLGDLARETRVDWALMAPTHMQRFSANIDIRRSFSSVRRLVHSSAPCPEPLLQTFIEALGRSRVWEYYGAVPYDGTLACPADKLRFPATVGRPLPTTKLRVVDPDWRPTVAGLEGTIIARSTVAMSTTCLGSRLDERGGWVTVGDRGWLSEEGLLFLASGLPSDRIITGGINVDRREIAAAILSHPDICAAEVRGEPDPNWGQRIVADVSATSEKLNVGDITVYLRSRLSPHKIPKSWNITY